MKTDKYSELFDSMKIRDEVYEKLVADTMQKYRKNRRRRNARWIPAAAAGIPALAVLCLMLFFRFFANEQHGSAVEPVQLEKTSEEEAPQDISAEELPPEEQAEETTPEQTMLEGTTPVQQPTPAVPYTTEPPQNPNEAYTWVPGSQAAEYYDRSAIVPSMEIVQLSLLDIAVDLYAQQVAVIEEVSSGELFASADKEDRTEEMENALLALTQKPAVIYHLEYEGSKLSKAGQAEVLADVFGSLMATAWFADSKELPFTNLLTSVSCGIQNYMSEAESLYRMAQRTCSMTCVEGLEHSEVFVFQGEYCGRGYFWFEFTPSAQGTMIVSTGFCPEQVTSLLSGDLLQLLGFTRTQYEYQGDKWVDGDCG